MIFYGTIPIRITLTLYQDKASMYIISGKNSRLPDFFANFERNFYNLYQNKLKIL